MSDHPAPALPTVSERTTTQTKLRLRDDLNVQRLPATKDRSSHQSPSCVASFDASQPPNEKRPRFENTSCAASPLYPNLSSDSLGSSAYTTFQTEFPIRHAPLSFSSSPLPMLSKAVPSESSKHHDHGNHYNYHHHAAVVASLQHESSAMHCVASSAHEAAAGVAPSADSSSCSENLPPHSPTSALLLSSPVFSTTQGVAHSASRSLSPSSQQRQTPAQRIRQHELHASDFQHEEVLGEGSYSLVSLATHRRSGLLFALKEIDRGRIQFQQLEPQLRWEINLQRTLRHPNIVRLYSYFITPSCISLVLEYCAGGTLLSRLKAAPLGRLSERQASRFTRHVARALAHLHDCGVAHRDLKLENVLIDDDGVAKLADFGWSRPVGLPQNTLREEDERTDSERAQTRHATIDARSGHCEAASGASRAQQSLPPQRPQPSQSATFSSSSALPRSTHADADVDGEDEGEAVEGRRTVCGTLDYLSPEMVSCQTHSFQTDVWSLGVMLAEMLTGTPPFYRDTAQETLRAIRQEPPNLSERVNERSTAVTGVEGVGSKKWMQEGNSTEGRAGVVLSDAALSLVESMLQKDPSRRPTMREVLQHPWLQKQNSARLSS